jgi:hypothetical protein
MKEPQRNLGLFLLKKHKTTSKPFGFYVAWYLRE